MRTYLRGVAAWGRDVRTWLVRPGGTLELVSIVVRRRGSIADGRFLQHRDGHAGHYGWPKPGDLPPIPHAYGNEDAARLDVLQGGDGRVKEKVYVPAIAPLSTEEAARLHDLTLGRLVVDLPPTVREGDQVFLGKRRGVVTEDGIEWLDSEPSTMWRREGGRWIPEE